VFLLFVGVTLGISFYFGKRAKSSEGYFAAHEQIPWFVNGIAFAGDYLSAASFLGICGMIAFYGYDGFLYSIGYLARPGEEAASSRPSAPGGTAETTRRRARGQRARRSRGNGAPWHLAQSIDSSAGPSRHDGAR
jgi:hypothetical protein